jgi:hypothetical protein
VSPLHPFVSAAALRYLYSGALGERVHTATDNAFLLCVFDGQSRTGTPRYFEVSQHSVRTALALFCVVPSLCLRALLVFERFSDGAQALSPPDFDFASITLPVTTETMRDTATVRLAHSHAAAAAAAEAVNARRHSSALPPRGRTRSVSSNEAPRQRPSRSASPSEPQQQQQPQQQQESHTHTAPAQPPPPVPLSHGAGASPIMYGGYPMMVPGAGGFVPYGAPAMPYYPMPGTSRFASTCRGC